MYRISMIQCVFPGIHTLFNVRISTEEQVLAKVANYLAFAY